MLNLEFTFLVRILVETYHHEYDDKGEWECTYNCSSTLNRILKLQRRYRHQLIKSTNAINACEIPQTTFTILDGFNEPNVVCIPNTNVAESADVIKNDAINNNAINDKTMPNGT